jgi:hypothetical protein
VSTSNVGSLYGTSAIRAGRRRSTRAQVEDLESAIYAVADAEKPCTIRGVFYRIMSQKLVPKSEQGYRQVQNRILLMRRGGLLPYGWISDGTRWSIKPRTWSGVEDVLADTAAFYRRALWNDQNVHLEIWSEKDAIRSVVSPVTAQFDVPLMVARGFASESFLYETAQDIIADDKYTVIYQLGDHDPSGVAAWEHTRQKLIDFAPDLEFEFERLAVTPEQIGEYDLPTRPTKQSDSRAAKFVGDSVEVDALPSPVLRDLVRGAIERWIPSEALRIHRIAEDSERLILGRMANEYDADDWRHSDGYLG